MDKRLRLLVAMHGAIVIVLGLLAGFPYAMVVTGAMGGEERAWRMAHAEGIQNGMLMLAVSGIAGSLVLDERRARLCAWSFLAAGYGNVLASVLGAATGNRGLDFALPLANLAVFSLFTVAIFGVLTGLGLVIVGARAGMRER